MAKDDKTYVVNEQTLDMYMGAQMSVSPHYDAKTYLGQSSFLIEKQSASFLTDYVNGEISLSEKAEQMMPDFLHILKKSSYAPIKKLLEKANKKYKADVIKRHKEDEKKKAFVTSRFKILENKKAMAKISSADMLIIAELLNKEKGYSTKRMKDKIKSFAMLRIDRVIKGEIPADKDLVKLAQQFGSYQQKNTIYNRFLKNQTIKQQDAQPTKTKKEGWFRRKWRSIKHGLVIAGVAFAGIIGGKMAFNNSQETASSDKQTQIDKTELTITPPNVDKPATTIEEVTDSVVNQEFLHAVDNLNKAYKDRFDTALEIHLGAENRDKLYQQIDNLEKEGKIQYKDGTTREWYAHAFTMYAKIAPYSEEGCTIARFLAGDEVTTNVLHDLVIKAKRDGTGVQGSGLNSNFDKAPVELQKKHQRNRKNVKMAEQNFQIQKAQSSR